jgi:hypothetical protein
MEKNMISKGLERRLQMIWWCLLACPHDFDATSVDLILLASRKLNASFRLILLIIGLLVERRLTIWNDVNEI